jgi:hypothetical protein
MSRDYDRDDRDDDRPRRRDDEPLTREELKRKVKPPGIALLVVGILSIALIGYGVFDYFVNFDKTIAAEKAKIDAHPTMPAAQKEASKDMMDQMAKIMKVATPILWVLEGIVTLFIIVGSTKMMSASSLGWSRAAAILAMIPCHGCWVLGIAIGIWAIIVLSNSQVKQAFAEGSRPGQPEDDYDRRDRDRDRDDRRD